MKRSALMKLQYFMIGLIIFFSAVFVAVATRVLLVQDGGWLPLADDNQASLATSMIEGAVGAVAAAFVLYQLKVEEKMESRENDIQEAQFILQYNQAFIQDRRMGEVEHHLEQWMISGTSDDRFINDENRQNMVNYLVYLEGLAPLIFRGVLTLEHIDDLMAYRFFLAVNNPIVQKDQLFAFPDYYRGCFRLYKIWKEYRLRKGYPILMDETGLDQWQDYSKYVSDNKIIIRPLLDGDSLTKVSELIYETDPYIYPAMFGTLKKAKEMIPKWMKMGNGIFRTENVIIAEDDGHIVGVLLFADGTRQEKLAPRRSHGDRVPDSFEDVCEKYFDHILLEERSDIYIACVCVDQKRRGEHFASQMLAYFMDQYPHRSYRLDVLSNSKNAIHLYEKCGFAAYSEGPGYAFDKEPPASIHMVRDAEMCEYERNGSMV